MAKLTSKIWLASIAMAVCVLLTQSHVGATVQFDWTTVGNANNTADSLTGYGSVGYNYRISTYEVTVSQYVEFMNAADPDGTNTLGLYTAGMRGVTQNTGNPSGSKYIVSANWENRPVSHVSWYSAARMVNWLHNGQGVATTESGVYDLSLISTDPNAIARSGGATVFLPSQDEWYKAAYYNGSTDEYFLYANGSDTQPVQSNPANDASGANYYVPPIFAITGTNSTGSFPLSEVGAYIDNQSPYGTYDQNGNVREWLETLDGSDRAIRGASYASQADQLQADIYVHGAPGSASSSYGFRVGSVIPEPSSLLLLAGGAMMILSRFRASRD